MREIGYEIVDTNSLLEKWQAEHYHERHGHYAIGQNISDRSKLAAKGPSDKPEKSSLGLLGMLPAEVRLNVFEIVLEIDRPITTRKCCGVQGELEDLCQYHARIRKYPRKACKHDRSRFALITVSRAVNHDVSWVMHNRMKVHAELSTLVWWDKDASAAYFKWKAFDRMWDSVTRFRLLELSIPGPATSDNITCLRDGVSLLFEYWDKHDMHSAEPSREVAIQLRNMFDANQFPRPPKNSMRVRLATLWETLEHSVQVIVVKDRKVKWKFTAMSDIGARGQKYLNRFQELLGKVDIEFGGETRAYEIEARGATGGTHRRFID
ncbi:hypothetical protein P171DRAFT_523706 [Karstenula rhodostoma CBS 690.94]|uniref:Uncharacterized protein n=1 Tax=Karstenula rhodostoma CBS 690.94 TaxID=1392251 RepID=A0A9P4U920_9PLEO|nr:hypothetical protein P171DRAFT_523706 [Karstenula rhodostoma CBS 690.94]